MLAMIVSFMLCLCNSFHFGLRSKVILYIVVFHNSCYQTSLAGEHHQLDGTLNCLRLISVLSTVIMLVPLCWFYNKPIFSLQWEDSVNEKYPHIVYEELCKAYDAEKGESFLSEDDSSDNIEGL